MRLQIGPVGQDDGPIDGVLQLAHVPGPIVDHQQLQRLCGRADHALALLDVEAAHEVLDQIGDVLSAFTQGGRLDGEDIQAIEQVLAETAGRHRLRQVAVGGRDHPHIDPGRALGADGVDLPFLQGAQQLDLHVQGQLADLVQEQGAAVSLLELAEVPVGGAGE